MNPMIWVGILLAGLLVEFVKMELVGACVSIGCAGALIANAFGLEPWKQIIIAVVITVALFVGVRPFAMRYVNEAKRHRKVQDLVGKDAIVICAINNAQGVGMVSINGKNWSARSHRANCIIREGTVAKVVAMNGNVAIVDDGNRYNRR